MISASAVLQAWESGIERPLFDRAPALAGLLDRADLDALTVGQVDALQFDLCARLFGDAVDTVARCPRCAEPAELALSLATLRPDSAPPSSDVAVECDGWMLAVRRPLESDLRALARLGDAVDARDVLVQCLVSALDPGGHAVSADEIPQAAIDTVLDQLTDADPGAHILLAITCPCGEQWTEQFDIRTILWDRLTEWATRLLHDVHYLATAYGWSEPEVLALSSRRRDWYRRAAGW